MSTYLWQNFLKDSAIRSYIWENIAKFYKIANAQALIEIGPWKGAITKKIKDISENFFVIEKDLTMEEHLLAIGLNHDQIIFQDILQVDFQTILSKINKNQNSTLVVGNLPYYITSPIFRLLFTNHEKDFFWGIFMIQDEVGLKIISSAAKKSYLWRLLNWGYTIEYLKMVPPKAFSPAPKVKSCLVKFIKKTQHEDCNFKDLEKFLNLYAPYSRKTLGRINKIIQKNEESEAFPLPEELLSKRLEELSREDIKKIIKKSDS